MKELAPRCFDDLERASLPKLALELPVGSTVTRTDRLEVEQDVLAGGISGAVYDAAIHLAHYLTAGGGLHRELCTGTCRRASASPWSWPKEERPSDQELEGKAVLELGCGAGLPGLAAAALGARTVLTDRSPVAVELATRNINRNGLQLKAEALQWAWGDGMEDLQARGTFDLILLSDVLYREDIVPPLLASVAQLLALRPGSTCLMAYSLRNSAAERRFKVEASKLGIKLERVPYEPASLASLHLHKVVHIARLRRA